MEKVLNELQVNIENVVKDNKNVKDQLENTKTGIENLETKIEKMDETFQNMQKEMISNTPKKTKTKEDVLNAFGKAAKSAKNGDDIVNLMQVGVDKDGGAISSTDIEKEIIRIVEENSVIRSLADVRSTDKKAVEVRVQTKGTTGGWVGETDERTETDTPEYKAKEIKVHEEYVKPKVTNEILEDADVSVATEIVNATGEAFAELEGGVFYTGDGVGKPFGLLVYPQKVVTKKKETEWGKMNTVKTGVAGGFGDALINVLVDSKKVIKKYYKQRATWLMSSSTLAELEKLTDADGHPLITRSHELGAPQMLKGFKITTDDYMPEVDNAEGLPFIVFGDIKATYRIYDRRGLKTIVDNVTESGFTKYYTSKRVGADVVNFDSFVGIVAKA